MASSTRANAPVLLTDARMHLRQRLSSSWALISFIMHPPSMKP